ncbi:hypothetical protein QJS10_CPB12g00718 [Acorus calamus]|uniref:Uncharacterized protein n=1 Tax=Acorus calamus TaxID=4465 RepID=A0AAV9DPB9_ACOCL|nr:hypothetical protein QJS10_CPB12g00718 [Acorus calamus]
MWPIKLLEPPSVSVGMPEVFGGGAYSVVRRTVVIGNEFAGAENQCVGLVRALGLSDRQSLYRVLRPRGGNLWVAAMPYLVLALVLDMLWWACACGVIFAGRGWVRVYAKECAWAAGPCNRRDDTCVTMCHVRKAPLPCVVMRVVLTPWSEIIRGTVKTIQVAPESAATYVSTA